LKTVQPLVDLGHRQEDRIIRPPDLQGGGEKLDCANFGSEQFVYDGPRGPKLCI